MKSDTAAVSVDGVGNIPAKTQYQGPYTTLWVGYRGDGDWPECSGVIESVVVEPLQ